jgi:hypothetical protein
VAPPIRASIVQISVFVLAWLLFLYVLVGPLAFAYVMLFAGGFILWWTNLRHTSIDPQKIIVPYLLTVIMFIVHVFEEYKAHLLGFPDIVAGAPFPISFEMMLTFAASFAPVIWLLGAVFMLKKQPAGFFIASTFLFGMMVIEPTHFLASFWPIGTFHYVGGLWTAVLPTSLGWFTFVAIRGEISRERAASLAVR